MFTKREINNNALIRIDKADPLKLMNIEGAVATYPVESIAITKIVDYVE